MTTTLESPQADAPAVLVYRHGQAPAHLRTVTRLAAIRLQPAPGQRPVCYVIPYYHPSERRALYEPADAVPILRSLGDQWAWQARRTCPRCGEIREQVLNGRVCGHCRLAGEATRKALDARTCGECRRVGRKPYPRVKRLPNTYYDLPMCRACRAQYRRRLDAQVAQYAMCPGTCGTRTQTRAQVLAAMTGHRSALKRCGPCEATRKAEQEARSAKARAERDERKRREREARENELAELRAWATAVLADPDAVILDTETTGLSDDARIVDIAVTTVGGQALLDTLVNPGEPIPPSATAIHGITDEMVKGAPSFAGIADGLRGLLSGKRVIIYNAQYDMARLAHEFSLLCDGEGEAAAVAESMYVGVGGINGEDAMAPYSDWCGDWSDYHGNYAWQPLNGGHRALGDCLAVIGCLKAMARSAADTDEGAA